jgi:hypothetical protein
MLHIIIKKSIKFGTVDKISVATLKIIGSSITTNPED